MSLISIRVRSARAPKRRLYPRFGLNLSPWIFLPRSWPTTAASTFTFSSSPPSKIVSSER